MFKNLFLQVTPIQSKFFQVLSVIIFSWFAVPIANGDEDIFEDSP